jgi:hypothetical protein
MCRRDHKSAVIDLLPVRCHDGAIRYVAWPGATAAVVCEAFGRSAVSVLDWLARLQRERPLLWGCCAAVIVVALSSGHSAGRGRPR